MFVIYTTPPLCKGEQCKWNSLHHLMQESTMEASAWLTGKASLTRYLGSSNNKQAFFNCSLPFKEIFKKKVTP